MNISGNQVWYTIGKTINIGNFENIKFEIGESRTVESGENPEEIYKSVRKDVNNRMKEITNRLQKDTEDQ